MNDVFRALSDPTRREILELLRDLVHRVQHHRPGKSLGPGALDRVRGEPCPRAFAGVGVKVNAPSIFSQAPSWLELQESMGSNCGGKSTFYKRGHDPAYWYTPIAQQCKVNDIPAATSAAGLRA